MGRESAHITCESASYGILMTIDGLPSPEMIRRTGEEILDIVSTHPEPRVLRCEINRLGRVPNRADMASIASIMEKTLTVDMGTVILHRPSRTFEAARRIFFKRYMPLSSFLITTSTSDADRFVRELVDDDEFVLVS